MKQARFCRHAVLIAKASVYSEAFFLRASSNARWIAAACPNGGVKKSGKRVYLSVSARLPLEPGPFLLNMLLQLDRQQQTVENAVY